MTIRVELNPEMRRQLAAEALARGIELEVYAMRLLQEAMISRGKGQPRASQEEFRAFLDALASKAPWLYGFNQRRPNSVLAVRAHPQ